MEYLKLVSQATGKPLSAELSAQEATLVNQLRCALRLGALQHPPSADRDSDSIFVQMLQFVGRALLVETLIDARARQQHLSPADLQAW